MESKTRFELNYFIFLGSPAHGDCFGDDGDSVIWTARKNALDNDVVFFYFTAPVSSIVACGRVVGEPWLNEDIFSDWEGYWMTEVGHIEVFDRQKYIPIRKLREVFPDWRWLRYPRANTQVPAEIVKPFLELMRSFPS
jgi:hypothetical protein